LAILRIGGIGTSFQSPAQNTPPAVSTNYKRMKKLKIVAFSLFILLITGCSSWKEAVMPFRNMDFSGERLFPIEESSANFAFRAWINNGTSIDRVITVSNDSSFGNQCKLVEMGFFSSKGLIKKNKTKPFFNEQKIEPNCGYESFKYKVDSLKLFEITSQDTFEFVLDHQPFSLYTIEIKEGEKYNSFTFRTHFPKNEKVQEKYEAIEKLIFEELNYHFYMNNN
jgi:hypothetical protein